MTSSAEQLELGVHARLPLELVSGEGPWVLDAAGSRHLDAYASEGAAILGHSHAGFKAALADQAGRLVAAGGLSSRRAAVARRLCRLAPDNLQRVLFVDSANEANDVALKIARRFRDRRKVIAFRGGFHGRTYGAGSVTALPPYGRQFSGAVDDAVPGTVVCRWGDMQAVRDLMGGDVAGAIVEPVQVLRGCRAANAAFLRELEEVCRARAGVLILDETRSAPGRVGAVFAAGLLGVQPHLLTLGSSVANGVPCGAVLVDRGLSETIVGPELGAECAGGPLAMAAADVTLAAVESEGLAERAARLGEVLAEGLSALAGVSAVRGLGLLRGVALDRAAAPVIERLRAEEQVLAGACADPKTVLVAPPLVVTDADVKRLVAAFEKVLAG